MQSVEAERPANISIPLGLEKDLSDVERELLQEVIRAVRVIRYGTVVLTLHEGRVVEIQKTERIRKASEKRL